MRKKEHNRVGRPNLWQTIDENEPRKSMTLPVSLVDALKLARDKGVNVQALIERINAEN